jgi:hypothetical protein
MTFNPSVPDASVAPNLFPPQNSANFTQLRKIIVADHQFNNTAQANDGFHNQCTMINRSAPGSLPSGANGIFYSFLDANSQSQLSWYNGNTNHVLTPYDELLPIRIVGSATSVGPGGTSVVLSDPGYQYMGSGFAALTNFATYRYQSVFHGANNVVGEINSETFLSTSRPRFIFSGNDLLIQNTEGALSRDLTWSIIINRVT